ncbi:uncharacterized protein [Trachinotus anak]|uniref:uncharacterized protein n=1 Tax=Trachinotus anak TaxID=443729 RepID=UPI0039F23461
MRMKCPLAGTFPPPLSSVIGQQQSPPPGPLPCCRDFFWMCWMPPRPVRNYLGGQLTEEESPVSFPYKLYKHIRNTEVEDIMSSRNSPTCQCSMELQNKSAVLTLCNPQVHNFSGSCDSPLPPTLSPSESGSALFAKSPHGARGSVGVFTSDLLSESTNRYRGRVAAMFSILCTLTGMQWGCLGWTSTATSSSMKRRTTTQRGGLSEVKLKAPV